MKRIFLILIVALTAFISRSAAQASYGNDSLRHNIKIAANDSLRVEALYQYMKANLNNNTSDFEPYIKQMIFLSKKINFRWGLSTAYILSLSYHKNKGNFDLALNYADSAESVTKGDTSKDMRVNMGHIHLNRGNLFYNIADYENALKEYFQAEKSFRRESHPSLASVYKNISNCFMGLHNHPKALEYAGKSIASAREFGDERATAANMMGLATEYINIDNYPAADSILNVALPIIEKLRNSKLFHVYYYNKGDVEGYYKKDTTKALAYYQRSYEYAMQNEDVWQEGKALQSIVNFQMEIKHKNAKGNIDKLYSLGQENQMDDYKADAFDYYAQWYYNMGDYKKAYDYQRKYHEISDSLTSEELKEKAAMMEVRFRVANKEQEINQLKAFQKIQRLTILQKSILNYILIGSVLTILIILILSYRNYRHRQKLQQVKIDELETEKQLTATEAVLKGEEQERTRLAKDLHDGLGGMLSGIKFSLSNMKGNLMMTPVNAQAFERSIDMLDSSINEMRRVAHNMMPEILLKYGLDIALKEFCNEIDRSGAIHVTYQSMGMNKMVIEQTTAVTIYRIVQELVNNAIKHAQAKNVLVQLHQSKQENSLAVTVEDDGNGFDTEILRQAEGIGWKNIQNRVGFMKGKLDVQSSPGKGTSVMIEITF